MKAPCFRIPIHFMDDRGLRWQMVLVFALRLFALKHNHLYDNI